MDIRAQCLLTVFSCDIPPLSFSLNCALLMGQPSEAKGHLRSFVLINQNYRLIQQLDLSLDLFKIVEPLPCFSPYILDAIEQILPGERFHCDGDVYPLVWLCAYLADRIAGENA